MTHNSDGWIYPPKPYFQQVIRHCACAADTYWKLWDMKDHDSKVIIYDVDVPKTLLRTRTKFHYDMTLLVEEGVISVSEASDERDWKVFSIEMTEWDAEAADELSR
jgi:hypothetical protein